MLSVSPSLVPRPSSPLDGLWMREIFEGDNWRNDENEDFAEKTFADSCYRVARDVRESFLPRYTTGNGRYRAHPVGHVTRSIS